MNSRISHPIRTLVLLAAALAFLIMFLVVQSVSGLKKPTAEEWKASSFTVFEAAEPTVEHTGTTRRYDPPSSSSGGGGHSGGGGGGGGHSGGGGSHSF